jgi:hypothetical protein
MMNSWVSHLISIPPGPHILSDVLMTTPIVGEEGAAPTSNFEFGVDPSLDPELALVIESIQTESLGFENVHGRRSGTSTTHGPRNRKEGIKRLRSSCSLVLHTSPRLPI